MEAEINSKKRKLITQIGGKMKKVLLTSLLVLVMVFAFALTNDNIRLINAQPENAKPITMPIAKDADAIAAGGVAIFDLGGDMRGFAPTPLTSIISDPAGNYIQVVSALANSGVFEGVYYTISTDGGGTWAAPVRITAAGGWLRNYNAIAADPTAWYPSVVACQRSASMFGTWYTTDLLGPGGGSWTTPALISDTVNWLAYMPSVTVNADGSKIAYVAYDGYGAYGRNYSSDYGSTWGTYDYDEDMIYDMDGVDVSKVVWGAGDMVYGFLGGTFAEDYQRSDIAASGPDWCISVGLSVSSDGGADYDTIQPLFGGHSLPQRATMNGDPVTYYIDTLDNGVVDMEPVSAFLDTVTGGWTDDLGNSLADGFGSWWYWWDAEYYNGALYAAIPMADMFFDYYDSGTALYTFPWAGQSIMLGRMDITGGDTEFTWVVADVHDDVILDTFGNTATWRGNAYSANLVFDGTDVYVVYVDYPDTATGISSIEVIKWDQATDIPWLASTPAVLNAGVYEVEASMNIDANNLIHIGAVSGTEDSIYYWNVDYTTLVFDINVGIEDSKTELNNNVSFFNVPSIVRENGEISFSLNSASNVTISLYDLTGREVTVLANSSFNAGTHTVRVSTADLSQGVYFASIKTDTRNDSKKIIVVK